MTQSLLDEAKGFTRQFKHDKFSNEEIELAVAWSRGEVSLFQVRTALVKRGGEHSRGSSIYTFLALALRQFGTKGIPSNEG